METKFLTINHTPTRHDDRVSRRRYEKMCAERNSAIRKLQVSWLIFAVVFALILLYTLHMSAKVDALNEGYSEAMATVSALKEESEYIISQYEAAIEAVEAREKAAIEAEEEAAQVIEQSTSQYEAATTALTAYAINSAENTSALEYVIIDEAYSSIPLDDEVIAYAITQCDLKGFPVEVLFALMSKESTFNTYAVSATNDHGLCQINASNFDWLSRDLGISNIAQNIYNPYINIDCSLYILTDLISTYNFTTYNELLMAYNMGYNGATNLWVEGIYSTTYSREIVSIASGYGYDATYL